MSPRIKRIDHIRGFGSFKDWEWEPDTPDFAKYTLIYGWNGSGKTTLARLLRSIETSLAHEIADDVSLDFRLTLDGDRTVDPDSVQQLAPLLRVFNQDYVKENLQFDEKAQTSPLLVLGKERVQLSASLAEARNIERGLSAQIAELSSTRDKAESDLSEKLAGEARAIKQGLSRSATDTYANYNQASLKLELDALSEEDGGLLSDVERASERIHLNATRLGTIKTPSPVDVAAIREAVARAAERVSESIPVAGSLDWGDDQVLLGWLSQGVELHPSEVDTCLFCTSVIPDGRLAQLHERFSRRYREMVTNLELAHDELAALDARVGAFGESIAGIDDSNLYANLRDEWNAASGQLKRTIESVNTAIRSADRAVIERLQNPYVEVDSAVVLDQIAGLTDALRGSQQLVLGLLQRNQDQTAMIDERRQQAQQKLERHACLAFKQEYRRRVAAISDAGDKIRMLDGELVEARSRIEELEREASSQARAAEMLNSCLDHYFGSGFLTAEPLLINSEDVGLQLRRSGAIATHLSEGERGGIALAYFLVEIRDAVERGERLIVVLDDPVSSLDDNGLFQAESLVRGIGSSVDQLLVLTHNFTFFRRVRRWMLSAKNRRKRSRLLYLATRDEGGRRVPVLRELPDLLRIHESDYQYLFSVVAAASAELDPMLPESELAQAPNASRRVLETFLGFRCPNSTDFKGGLLELEQQQPTVFVDIDVDALAAFLDEGSHDRSLDTASTSLLASYLDRRRYADVMRLIKRADPQHYSSMINVCLRDGISLSSEEGVGESGM